MTNFDRIKQMTIEEMAILLGCIYSDNEDNTRTIMGKTVFDTTSDVKEWLESEVDENANCKIWR